MADESLLSLLKQGVAAWNQWWHKHRRDRVHLGMADVTGTNLSKANLITADLSQANLSGANLNRAQLIHTNLDYTTLTRSSVYGVSVWGYNGEPSYKATEPDHN
jgi:uncharacterized protein YjbI with pentapeptide repeats